MTDSLSVSYLIFTVNEAVNPLSIDPNERVTPSGQELHNGDSLQSGSFSLGVSEIGVIPPPPMFSSPSPPSRHIIPPPKEHSSHHGVGVTSARGHDLPEHPPIYSDDDEDPGCDDEAEDECDADLPHNRVVSTVPAKEPRLDAVPLKSALKKPGLERRGGAGTPPSQNGRQNSSTPPREKQNSR